jgi:hypothetical protein
MCFFFNPGPVWRVPIPNRYTAKAKLCFCKNNKRTIVVKGWQTKQIVFVGGTCGSVHVESFNKNMKALGVLESKWNPIRQKLVRRLLEEQDKVLRSYFAQKGGTRGQRGEGTRGQGREHVKWDMYV